MAESATLSRERRRWATSYRITGQARRLTDRRGLDGWTMDDLAAACEVSRRTLFNYFPGKVDAVLGAVPEVPASVRDDFLAGGPHGDLLEDLGELARALLSEGDFDRESLELGRRVLVQSPRLLVAAHARFESVTGVFVELIQHRAGERLDAARARLLVRLMVGLFDAALDAYLSTDDGRPIADWYVDTLHTARELLT